MRNKEEAQKTKGKWFPYNKGGEFRKWYGNNDHIVNYKDDGIEIKESVLKKYPYLKTPDFVVKNTEYYFHECFSWSKVSSGIAAFRYKPCGFIFDVAGACCFSDLYLQYLLALCNSKISLCILEMVSPTINYECGAIANIPVIVGHGKTEIVNTTTQNNVSLSKNDWDSFETSWDFKKHPMI